MWNLVRKSKWKTTVYVHSESNRKVHYLICFIFNMDVDRDILLIFHTSFRLTWRSIDNDYKIYLPKDLTTLLSSVDTFLGFMTY